MHFVTSSRMNYIVFFFCSSSSRKMFGTRKCISNANTSCSSNFRFVRWIFLVSGNILRLTKIPRIRWNILVKANSRQIHQITFYQLWETNAPTDMVIMQTGKNQIQMSLLQLFRQIYLLSSNYSFSWKVIWYLPLTREKKLHKLWCFILLDGNR